MTESYQGSGEKCSIDNPGTEVRQLKDLGWHQQFLTPFTAGETLPHFELQKRRNFAIVVGKIAVPANTNLILSEFAGCRSCVLVKVRGIEIQAIDLTFGVLAIWATDLPQQGIGKANISGNYKELPLKSLDELTISGSCPR